MGLPADSLPPAIRDLRLSGPGRPTLVPKHQAAKTLYDSLRAVGDTTGLLFLGAFDALVETRLSLERNDTTTYNLATEVLARKRALGWAGHPEEARSLVNLARINSWAFDHYALADSLYAIALAVLERACGVGHPDVGHLLRFRAEGRHAAGDAVVARAMAQRGLACIQTASPPDTFLLLQIAGPLQWAHTALGLYDDAIDIQQWRLDMIRAFNPNNVRGRLILEIELGIVEFEAGRPAEAVRRLQLALDSFDASGQAPNSDLRGAYVSLGAGLALLGDLRLARTMLARGLEMRADEDTSRSYFGEPHLWLGAIELAEGRPARARPHLERARAVATSRLGAGHPSVSEILEPLALCIAAQGHPDSAATLLDEARRIHVSSGSVAATSQLEMTEARIRRAAGQDEAADQIERRLANAEPGPGNRARRAWIDASRAVAQREFAAGERAAAFMRAITIERSRRSVIVESVRSLPERQALLLGSRMRGGLDIVGHAVLSGVRLTPEERREFLDEVIRSRALVLDEVAGCRRRELARAGGPDAAAWLRREQARRRLHAARSAPARELSSDQRAALLFELQREVDIAETTLLGSGAGQEWDQPPEDAIGLAAVEVALGSRSALVSILRVRSDADDEPAGATSDGYVAFVQRGGASNPSLIPLGPAAALDEVIRNWRAEAFASTSEGRRGAGAAGDALRRLLWDPIASELRGVEVAYIVPDGSVGLVSLASLPDSEGRFLAEVSPQIHLLACERDLISPGKAAGGSQRLAVLIGGVDYERASTASQPEPALLASLDGADFPPELVRYRGPQPTCTEFARRRFAPLPAAGGEVADAIASLRGADAGQSVRSLMGSLATEEAVRQAAASARLLHVASHGFTVADECGGVASSGLGAMGWSAAEETLQSDNPLTRCGLALAGANRRADVGPDEDDGLLTGDEIAALDLSGVEFVVLSACNTGVGEVLDGEGVLGLQRAFKIAGAGPVVMSLWPVEDQVARQWMRHFYAARLTEGVTTAEATRRASLAMLAERRRLGLSTRPSTWAPFVSVGVER